MDVRIGEIRIRFKGIPRKLAQESVDGIEEKVLDLLTKQYTQKEATGFNTHNIEAINAGIIECHKGAFPEEVKTIIAERIAGRIAGLVEAKIR